MEERERRFVEMHYDTDIKAREYSECIFEHCIFAGIVLIDVVFDNCAFVNCTFRDVNLAGLRMQNATFRDTAFINIDWSEIRYASKLFPLVKEISKCILKYNNFSKMKLLKLPLVDSSLIDCAFLECDLSGSVFKNVDLQDTSFQECNLSKADFREARNYRINPESNRMHKAKFSLPEVVGLLTDLDISIE